MAAASPGAVGGSYDVYLEHVGGGSRKFWAISVDGPRTTTVYGRIGSQGRQLVKEHASEEAADSYARGLEAEKRGSGYADAARPGATEAPAATVSTQGGRRTRKAGPSHPEPRAGDGAAAAPAAAALAAPAFSSYLECTQGTSSKFWSMVVAAGATETQATWGRIGTGGTTTTKDFGDHDAAVEAARKQEASKLKKGYHKATPPAADPLSLESPASGEVPAPGALRGREVVLSGTFWLVKSQVEAAIVAAGGSVASRVTEATDVVVCAKGTQGTTKHKAALRLGVRVEDEAWLRGALAADATAAGGTESDGAGTAVRRRRGEAASDDLPNQVGGHDTSDPAVAKAVREALAATSKCYVPVTDASLPCSATDDKIGGEPYMPEGDAWPVCGICNSAMEFFVQYDLSRLPEPQRSATGPGLFQLWMCNGLCGFAPFEAFACARIVELPAAGAPSARAVAASMFPEQRIVKWEAREDHPRAMDYVDGGLCDLGDGPDDLPDALEERWPCYEAEKAGGWPHWSQGAEWPSCRECGATMRNVLFQVFRMGHPTFLVGDMGTAHAFQCPACKGELTVGWACS